MTLKFRESSFIYGINKDTSFLSACPDDGPLVIFMHGWPAIAQIWHPQIATFSRLGFKVIAPDMPGYGHSYHEPDSYSTYLIPSTVNAMLALLSHLGHKSAIWVGHDQGCGVLWGLASHHPSACRAVVSLTMPYRTIEAGLEECLKYVNRNMHPADQFPYCQWGYIAFYQQDFERATAWFMKDTPGAIKALFCKGDPKNMTKASEFVADAVAKDGWYGGIPRPPSEEVIPDEQSCIGFGNKEGSIQRDA